ncbi:MULTISPECIES: CorA family divalent cation transporter [Streptomyces]|nr:CorA family divalent cation transporter [Streptomyces sp. NRRL S-104]
MRCSRSCPSSRACWVALGRTPTSRSPRTSATSTITCTAPSPRSRPWTSLDSVLGAQQARVGTWQNDDMRRISAWAAISAIPTMVAGAYGMNFEDMPELAWTYGYPLAVAPWPSPRAPSTAPSAATAGCRGRHSVRPDPAPNRWPPRRRQRRRPPPRPRERRQVLAPCGHERRCGGKLPGMTQHTDARTRWGRHVGAHRP